MALLSLLPGPMAFGCPAWVVPQPLLAYAPPPAPAPRRRRGHGGGRRRVGAQPTPHEIRAAVESLYRDELRPFGRLVRKRLGELAAEMGGAERFEHLGDRDLRAACEACRPWLAVADAEGGEWIATLAGQPQLFVDAHCVEDPYPPQLWSAAAAYFEALPEEERLPGGRYSCSRMLAARGLPFLEGRSLGQVAHIVQLAISHRKLLGYSEGFLVPYARSKSMVKERQAESGPCASDGDDAGVVATWDHLRDLIQQLLKSVAAEGKQSVALSNVKFLFHARFGLELRETTLGYAKLSELLQDPRLSDICEVRLQSAGHVLVGVRVRNRISLAEGLRLTSSEDVAVSGETMRSRPQPLCIDEIASPPRALDGGAVVGDDDAPGSGTWQDVAAMPSTTPFRMTFPPTPSPYGEADAYGLSLPRLLGSTRATPGRFDALKECVEAPAGDASPKAQCAGTERDGAEVCAAVPLGDAGGRKPWAPRPLTPSTLDSLGFSVHNTFLHAVVPPPTPLQAASRLRASSLPRAG